MNSRRFALAHAQDIVGIIAILFFSFMFSTRLYDYSHRPEVRLSIIVKCNVRANIIFNQ